LSAYKNIRHAAWWLLKAPQRKIVGYSTLLTDIKGVWRFFASPKPKDILWICVGNLNREQNILEKLLPSMLASEQAPMLGLSIMDCGSAGFANFEKELREKWPHALVIESKAQVFARAAVFNQAIAQAPGEFIMAMDADMSLPSHIYDLALEQVRVGRAWFPICQWQVDDGQDKWCWFTEGTGLFAAYKSDFEKAGAYNTDYITWGKEDWDLFFSFYKQGICPVRTKVPGLYHHWHASLKPANFEKWF
jgi:hypothetical protein